MRSSPLRWFLLSLALFGAGIWFWRLGNERRVVTTTPPPSPPAATNSTAQAPAPPGPKSLRVSNTSESAASLARKDNAILLRNAVIDTSRPLTMEIPAALRATNGRSFLVHSPRPLDNAFYRDLAAAGAHYISYIPNDAALVEASAQAAATLTNYTVIPYQPYYKLSSDLLADSVNETPVTGPLIVVTPPGSHDEALAEIRSFGWGLIGEDKTPMGPEFIVQAPGPDAEIAVAQWPLAQEVEMFHRRQTMNDLTRVRVGVAADTIITTNYLGLDGENVIMGLNDTGADASHPDLANRINGLTDDFDGHGTHVAGIMIGDGKKSSTINAAPHIPPGSTAGASFRGMASGASLFVQEIDLAFGPFISNEDLETNGQGSLEELAQIEASPTTNGFISNNSWGYGTTYYDVNAASFDQAVRDSQPFVSGEQAMTYVFAAGNSGNGSGNGLDGVQNTISSPGTAKNVITVGAIDSPRFITNWASTTDCGVSNQLFLGPTSDSNLVSYFSSAGNVSPTLEGQFGRFKPDVVAPGVFIVSDRATNYVDPTNVVNVDFQDDPGNTLEPGSSQTFTFDVPPGVVDGFIQASPNALSISPFPTNIVITIGPDGQTPVTSQLNPLFWTDFTITNLWDVTVTAPGLSQPLNYDLNIYLVQTNFYCSSNYGYFNVLSNLNNFSSVSNQPAKPKYYLYDSGTSMSTAVVSGMLGLIQQFFAKQNFSPSPALLKALLINGARSLGNLYDFNTQSTQGNEQGWGLVNLPNSLPHNSSGATNLIYVEQTPLYALRTDESETFTVNLPDTNAANFPLRITLVWTDPPGNPAAGIALVNDLDLTVVDSTGTNIYIGNNFLSGDTFTEEGPAAPDIINNVENVYISPLGQPLTPPYYITVSGSRVNVNAVTTQTNNIEQDFALVVSSDDTNLTSSVTVTAPTAVTSDLAVVTSASNNVALVNQIVGANSPYEYDFATGQTNGTLAQWHFFVFTNDTFDTTGTNFTNVAFITFLPPEMSIPRASQQADIDLYVSTNSALTNLDSTVIAQAVAAGTVSRGPGGSESVVLSNSVIDDEVYYIGVKSEDQQAARFGFLSAASLDPFSSQNENGDIVAHSLPHLPPPVPIPDGAFDHPGPTNIFAVVEGGRPIRVRHIIVTNGIAHQNPGDLVGQLTLNGQQNLAVILNNRDGSYPTNYVYAYDDEPENAASLTFVYPGLPLVNYPVHTDGPGNLNQFVGQNAGPGTQWQLNETDHALGQTGSLTAFDILMEHQPQVIGGVELFVDCYLEYIGFIDVPDDTTNLTISVTYPASSGGGPVTIYATNNVNVGPQDLDFTNINTIPGGALVIDKNSPQPISGGTWYFEILNPDTTCLNVQVSIQESLIPNFVQVYTNNTPSPITVDAHTLSEICLPTNADGQVVSLNVGVRIDDPDLDDLVLHLTSPQGTSVLLFENRGGPAVTNLGLTSSNGFIYTTFTEDTNFTDTLIKFTPQFAFGVTNSTFVYSNNTFENLAAGIYTTSSPPVDGWIIETNEIGIVADTNTAHTGTNFLALTTGLIHQTFPTVPGDSYQLVYYARGPGIVGWWPGDRNPDEIVSGSNGVAVNVGYTKGVVGEAFAFDPNNFPSGTYCAVKVPDQPAYALTNSLSIEGWVRPRGDGYVIFWRGDNRPGLDPYALGMGGDSNISFTITDLNDDASTVDTTLNYGQWTHVAGTLDGYLGTMNLYTNGLLANEIFTTNRPFGQLIAGDAPGVGIGNVNDGQNNFPFTGDVDEISLYSRALSPVETAAIFRAGSAGKYSTNSIYPNITVTFEGVSTNLFISQSNTWQAVTNTFIATSDHTTVDIAGNSANSMLLDDISFIDLPATNFNNYFMPEESLSPFVGENPQGCWTLDVWDTRADTNSAPAATLISWTLDMTFSSTNVNLIVLTNHVPYTNSSPLPDNTFFAFDVPPTANFATNSLSDLGGTTPLSLVFNQTTLPAPTAQGNATLIPDDQTSQIDVLTAGVGTPPLVQGSRYFLAVNNPTPGAPQPFVLQIDTDVTTNGVIGLTNDIAYDTTNNTKNGQYYSFVVPHGAIMATFQLINVSGNLDLYARYGLPLPTPAGYDYESVVAGTNNQYIRVTSNSPPILTNSTPVPLLPGTWYLSVFNPGTNKVSYDIVASFVTNAASTNSGITIIPLTNGMAYSNSAPPGLSTIYYSFTNDPIDAGVSFGVSNIVGGNVDLLVGRDSLPTPSQTYAGSFNPGTTPQYVQTPTDGPHIWYLSVPNNTNVPVTYTITANDILNGTVTNYPTITNVYNPGGGLTLIWASIPGDVYQVDSSTNLVNWVNVITFTATNNVSSFTDYPPLTGPALFFRVEQVP